MGLYGRVSACLGSAGNGMAVSVRLVRAACVGYGLVTACQGMAVKERLGGFLTVDLGKEAALW